jgi:hypothetical protein
MKTSGAIDHEGADIEFADEKTQEYMELIESQIAAEQEGKSATITADDTEEIDVDDIYNIEDILAPELKEKFALKITEIENAIEDELHIGYLKLEKLI